MICQGLLRSTDFEVGMYRCQDKAMISSLPNDTVSAYDCITDSLTGKWA